MAYTISRPAAAFVLSLVAGIIILIVGIVITVVGAIFTLPIGGIGALFGAFGMLWGIIIIAASVMMFQRPGQHALWGSIVIVFSLVSIFGALGGVFIGLILGVTGGILGIIWTPDNRL